jgi:hypothetical protein
MATIFNANCKCGYEAQIFVGGTRATARTGTYHSPALCRECGKLSSSKFGLDSPTCALCQSTKIVSYDDPELRAASSEEHIELTNGIYYCPQCKDFGLSFKDVGPIAC